jgi:2-enoate reductase
MATGASASRPNIPGSDKEWVVVEDDVLLGKEKIGQKVAVIGGRCWGAEMAVSLADEGKEVALLEESIGVPPAIGGDFELFGRGIHVQVLLAQRGVKSFEGAKVQEITETGIKFLDSDDKEQFVEAETVIIAERRVPNRKLLEALKGKVSELYEIGDCVTTKYKTFGVAEAVYEGTLVGRRI